MKRLNSSSERRGMRRFALVGALAVGLLAPAFAATGSASAASTRIDKGFAAAGAKTALTGISVSGYEGKTVLASLSVSQGTLALSTTTGLTLSYGYTAFSGASLNFTGSQDAVNAAVKTLSVTLPATATGQFTVRTMFTESKAGVAYFPENQHFYQYVSYGKDFTGDKNAATAATAAAATKEFGLTGYLANISTSAENDFVSSKIEGAQNVWIGGSDAESENTWKFTDGPDKGTTFWTGCANDHPTTPGTSGSAFAKWAPVEPNNYIGSSGQCADGKTVDVNNGKGEDCMVTNWDPAVLAASPRPSIDKFGVGYWNDIPCEVASGSYSYLRVQGYVIEFGNQVASSSFPSGVDLRTERLTILPPAKIPAKAPSPVSKILKSVGRLVGIDSTCPRSLIRKKVTATVTLEASGIYVVSFHDKSRKDKLLPVQCGTNFGKGTNKITRPLNEIRWLAKGPLIEQRKAAGKPFTRTVEAYVDVLFAKNVSVQVKLERVLPDRTRLPYATVSNATIVRG